MFRGILAGIVYGGLASALMLALVSLIAPQVEVPQADPPVSQAEPDAGEPDLLRADPSAASPEDADAIRPDGGGAGEVGPPDADAQQPSVPDAAQVPGGVISPEPRDGDEAPTIAGRPDISSDVDAAVERLSALPPDETPEPGAEATTRPQLSDEQPRLDAVPDVISRDGAVGAPVQDTEIAAATPDAGQPVAPDAAPDAAMRNGTPAPAPQVAQPRSPEVPANAEGAAQPRRDPSAQARDDAVPSDGPVPGVRPAATDVFPPVFPEIAPGARPDTPPELQDPDPAQSPPDRPRVGLTPDPGVEISRLPRIGDDAPVEDPGPAPAAPDDRQAAADSDSDVTPLPAVRRHAAAFENPEDRPLFAIILLDDGIARADQERLARLPFPVTIAVDPLHADASERGALYRAEGKEVLMLASAIPQGATASDLEVTFQSHFRALPEAVGVLDRPEGGFQNNRLLAEQVITILAEDGYGLVTFDRGMNAAEQVARSAGLGAARVFRILDAENEQAATVRRYLDRAVFRAAQRGSVIVMGGSAEETLAGILEWRMEGRADAVALAPVSAVLADGQ